MQDKDLVTYKKAFDVFDLDGSGKISFTEVENLIQNISERKPHESETQEVKYIEEYFFIHCFPFKMLEMLDVDSDGLVDLKEFIKAMAEKTEVQNKTVQYSMERLDNGDNGDEMMQGMMGRIELGIMDVNFDIEVEDFMFKEDRGTRFLIFRKRTLKPSTTRSESLTKMAVGK